MRLGILAFFLGLLTTQIFSHLPQLNAWLIIPFLVLAWRFPRLRFMMFFMVGLIWMTKTAQDVLAQKLPQELEGQDVLMMGTILDIPRQHNYFQHPSWTFDFVPIQVVFQNQIKHFEGLVRLSWTSHPPHALRPGQRWKFTARLKRPHSFLNPGTPDYSGKLFRQSIQALGSVRSQKEQLLLSTPVFHINNFRYHLAETIQATLGKKPSTAIIIALAIGEDQWISPEQWDIFRKTGTIHLMAISGLHVGFITLLSFWLARRFWGYCGQAALWCPTHYFALWVSILSTFCYALLAGFSVPTQRTFIMISTALFMEIGLARQTTLSQILAVALLAVLLWDPFAIMDVGFWLSFGVVIFLVYVFSHRHQSFSPGFLRYIRMVTFIWALTSPHSKVPFFFFPIFLKCLRFSQECWAATLGLFPLSILFAIPFSIASLIANLIAIPVITFGVVPFTLLGSLFIDQLPILGNFFLHSSAYLFEILWPLLVWLGNIFKSHEIPIPPLWVGLVALGGTFILFLPRGFPARWIGFFGFLPLFFLPIPHPRQGEIWFTLLDVGQGLSAFIRTEHHTLIYDTGPKFSERFDAGQILVPFLRSQGIDTIDTLLLSHQDQDHIGGTQSLLNSFFVQDILTSSSLAFPRSRACHAGQFWHWDNVDFHILHPPVHDYFSNSNHRSCVLKVSTMTGSILLSGDIEKPIERSLIKRSSVHADILIVPHHGSRSSSTEAFIDAVKPKVALFSSGYQNRFHHPHPEVVQRYHRHHIQTWNTAQQGAISFRITQEGISPPQFARQELRRFWHLFE